MKKFLFILSFLLCQFVLAQNDSTLVSKPKLGLISADKLNIVYRGILNPISIAVPNAKSFTVSGKGMRLEDGKYYIAPGAGNEMVVTLEIILEDDSKVVEEHVLKIKTLKRYIARITDRNCVNCIVLMTKEELKDAKITFYFEDFLIELPPNKATSFDVFVFNKRIKNINKFKKLYQVKGDKITDELYNELIKLKKGTEILIQNIEFDHFKNAREQNISFAPIGVIHIKITD